MKFVILSLVVSFASVSAFAGAAECSKVAEEVAAKADKAKFGAEASSCGSKLLNKGSELETYLVCVSDETDPSEWIVVVEPKVINRNSGNVLATCQVRYKGYATDAASPNFDN